MEFFKLDGKTTSFIWILDFNKYRAYRFDLIQVLTESFWISLFLKNANQWKKWVSVWNFQKKWSEIFEDFPAAKRIPNSKHPIRIKLLFFCPSITIRTSWFQTDSNGEFFGLFFATTLHRINYQNFTALSVFLSFLWPQLRTPAVAYYLAAWSVAGWSKNGGGTSDLDVEADWEKEGTN